MVHTHQHPFVAIEPLITEFDWEKLIPDPMLRVRRAQRWCAVDRSMTQALVCNVCLCVHRKSPTFRRSNFTG